MIFIHVWWFLESTTSWFYALTSGPLGFISIPVAIAAYVYHHNCHTSKCPRMGHSDSTGKVICKRHLLTKAELKLEDAILGPES